MKKEKKRKCKSILRLMIISFVVLFIFTVQSSVFASCTGSPISVGYAHCPGGTCPPWECQITTLCSSRYIKYSDGWGAQCGPNSVSGKCADGNEDSAIYCQTDKECRVASDCANKPVNKYCGVFKSKNGIWSDIYDCDSYGKCYVIGAKNFYTCPDSTPFCNSNGPRCVQCLYSTDCTSKLKPPYCKGNNITTPTSMRCDGYGNCVVNKETSQPCTGATPFCIISTGAAICTSRCRSNSDCSGGDKCNIAICNLTTGSCTLSPKGACSSITGYSDGCCPSTCIPKSRAPNFDIDCKCSSHTQCDDKIFCNGIETCNPATEKCQVENPPNCSDNNYCTTDSCLPSLLYPQGGCNNDPAPMDGQICDIPGLSSLSPGKSFWNSLLKMFGITGKAITGYAVQQGTCQNGTCTANSLCGNGKVDAGEECDPGKFCADLKTSCTKNSQCQEQKGDDKSCTTRLIKDCNANCKFRCGTPKPGEKLWKDADVPGTKLDFPTGNPQELAEKHYRETMLKKGTKGNQVIIFYNGCGKVDTISLAQIKSFASAHKIKIYSIDISYQKNLDFINALNKISPGWGIGKISVKAMINRILSKWGVKSYTGLITGNEDIGLSFYADKIVSSEGKVVRNLGNIIIFVLDDKGPLAYVKILAKIKAAGDIADRLEGKQDFNPQGQSSSTDGFSVYIVRDSNNFSINGIAYIITPHIILNKNATVTMDYSYHPNILNPETYKAEDHDYILSSCNSNLINKISKSISSVGGIISLENEILINIPLGALDNLTNINIVKYNLSNCFSEDEDEASYNLIAYYSFEGDTNDASGNGNNGVNNGATFVAGKIGQAASFNGVNNYISIPDSTSLQSMSNGLTIGLWIKSSSNSGVPISRWSNPSAGGYGLYDDGKWYIGDGTTWKSIYAVSAGRLADNQWHYYTFVWNTTNMISYRDGSVIAISGIFINPYFLTVAYNRMLIGADNRNGLLPFNGVIDEVEIWNYALSDSEIKNKYDSYRKLVAYYPFEGDTNDASGNENNGINNGATFVAGKIGQAASFNGVNNYIEIPNSPVLQDITEESYTWSAWYYPNSLPPNTATHNFHSIICKQGFHTSLFYDNNANLGLFTWDTTKKIPTIASTFGSSLNNIPNKWYHITGVVDSTKKSVSLYVNGVLINSGTYFSLLDYRVNPIRIGICNNPGQNHDWPANGVIDEVKIWNYALSADEIQQEYSG